MKKILLSLFVMASLNGVYASEEEAKKPSDESGGGSTLTESRPSIDAVRKEGDTSGDKKPEDTGKAAAGKKGPCTIL